MTNTTNPQVNHPNHPTSNTRRDKTTDVVKETSSPMRRLTSTPKGREKPDVRRTAWHRLGGCRLLFAFSHAGSGPQMVRRRVHHECAVG